MYLTQVLVQKFYNNLLWFKFGSYQSILYFGLDFVLVCNRSFYLGKTEKVQKLVPFLITSSPSVLLEEM